MRKQQTLLHYALSYANIKESSQGTLSIRRALQPKQNVTTHKTKTTKTK